MQDLNISAKVGSVDQVGLGWIALGPRARHGAAVFEVDDIGRLTTRQHDRRMTEREQGEGAREQQRGEGGERGHECKATARRQ